MRFNKAELVSIFWTLALIGFIRAFILEPFKIPSGSMIPTLLVGDHLFVAKGSYDLGIPFTNVKLLRVADPLRGDVVVFEYPNAEKSEDKDGIYYIKRLIGLPGDRVSVVNGVPQIAGADIKDRPIPRNSPEIAAIPGFTLDPMHELFRENLPGMNHDHWVQRTPQQIEDLASIKERLRSRTGKDCIEVGKAISGQVPAYSEFGSILLNEICPFTVPPDHYFFMGDNRDESADGREWGLVHRDLLKGRALFVWMSFQSERDPLSRYAPRTSWQINWPRIGLGIK